MNPSCEGLILQVSFMKILQLAGSSKGSWGVMAPPTFCVALIKLHTDQINVYGNTYMNAHVYVVVAC